MKHILGAVVLALALAGCASDGDPNSSDQPFDAWVSKVNDECTYNMIGSEQVGWLLDNVASSQGTYFLDQMQRLFDGNISPGSFASDVSAFLNGRNSDGGIQCILARLPAPPGGGAR